MYTSKMGRRDVIGLWVVNACFLGFAALCYTRHLMLPVLFFGTLGVAYAIYTIYRTYTWVTFSPGDPTITVRKWPFAPFTLQPADCVKLTSTVGGISVTPKLVYRHNGHRGSIAMMLDYPTQRAWNAYTRKWLQAIKTSRTLRFDEQERQVEASPTEDYFNQHYGNSGAWKTPKMYWVVMAVLVAITALTYIANQRSHRALAPAQPDQSTTRSLQDQGNTIGINFAACTPDLRRFYTGGLTSTTIEVRGKTGSKCLMYYGSGVQNEWDGKPNVSCLVPTALGNPSYPKRSKGADLSSLDTYCKK